MNYETRTWHAPERGASPGGAAMVTIGVVVLTKADCIGGKTTHIGAMPARTKRIDFDGAWKRAVSGNFRSFFTLCFPVMASLIDWDVGFEFLDKELQQIARGTHPGKSFVDLLVKVRLKCGRAEWLFLHIEIQNSKDQELPARVFLYFTRARDCLKSNVVSFAVLTDDNDQWRSQPYVYQQGDFSITMVFPVCKVRDFLKDLEEFRQSTDPIKLFLVAHLETQQTKQDPEARSERKLALTKSLYRKGLRKEQIIELYTLIDWIMNLPREMEQKFVNTIVNFEKEIDMPYITSAERMGIEKGRREGRRLGRQEGRQETSLEVAERMLRKGLEVSLIAEVSGLPEEVIRKLAAN